MPYRLSGFRLTMNEQRRNAKFGELLDWAETVLRTQYPGYLAEQIRPVKPSGSHLEACRARLLDLAWPGSLPG
jgi:hypothetical protein